MFFCFFGFGWCFFLFCGVVWGVLSIFCVLYDVWGGFASLPWLEFFHVLSSRFLWWGFVAVS